MSLNYLKVGFDARGRDALGDDNNIPLHYPSKYDLDRK